MSKKHIIITAAGGLVSFGGMLAVALFLLPGGQPPVADANQVAPAGGVSGPVGILASGQNEAVEEAMSKPMSEKQLKALVFEVRERIKDYNAKLKEVELREQRLQTVQQTLKGDIDELNNLRVEMASMVAALKEERDKLQKARIEVSQIEKVNLTSIAATYDKMDSASASKIIASMCQNQAQVGASIDDAVKIIFYMTERTKAKLLAEMVTTEPKLAALLSTRLKQITEGR